jgi:hypothetical protein
MKYSLQYSVERLTPILYLNPQYVSMRDRHIKEWGEGVLSTEYFGRRASYGLARGHLVLLGNPDKNCLIDARDGTILPCTWSEAITTLDAVTDTQVEEWDSYIFELQRKSHQVCMQTVDLYLLDAAVGFSPEIMKRTNN